MFGLHVLQIQSLSSKTLSEILPNTQNTVDRKEDKEDEGCWYRTDERQAVLYTKKPLRSGE